MTTKEDMIDTIKVVMNYLYKDVGDTWYGDLLSDVLEELMNNSDAVPVVRCKDCKHCYVYDKHNFCDLDIEMMRDLDPNYYCASAERKEYANKQWI